MFINALDRMSSAQAAAVTAYAYPDVTTSLQSAMDAAFSSGKWIGLPAGGYGVTTLTMPGSSTARAKPFIMRGVGTGEVYAMGNAPGGTVLRSVVDAPLLQYIQDTPNTGNGQADISFINFWGNSSKPVVSLQAFYSLSKFHHNGIRQQGTGNGLELGYCAITEIHDNTIFNRDWIASKLLGAARVGVGIYVHNQRDAGLCTIRKNTSRGFRTGFKIGDAVPNHGFISTLIEHNECSVVYDGIEINGYPNLATVVRANYMEGGDGGTGIIDASLCSRVRDNFIYPGFSCGIRSGPNIYGGVYDGNTISVGSVPNTTCIQIENTGNYAGFPRFVSENTLIFGGSGGSIQGVVGVRTIGSANGLGANCFNPSKWVGGAGTAQIVGP